jgi:protein TonB
MGIQGLVFTTFIIDKDGTITNIQMRGPDKNLEVEA